jgi:protein-S-isoprenylcysteine O-methyltransferase Ste14
MSGDDPDKAQVIALPPLIVAAALALGLLFHFLWPLRFLSRTEALWLGGLLIAVSIAIGLGAVSQLVKAKTALDVRKPTMEIVTRGVYRLSRNPIYLSMILLLLGIALCVDSLWILLFAIPLAVILQKGVIEPEEHYLEQKFGEKYLRYKAKVRRWI